MNESEDTLTTRFLENDCLVKKLDWMAKKRTENNEVAQTRWRRVGLLLNEEEFERDEEGRRTIFEGVHKVLDGEISQINWAAKMKVECQKPKDTSGGLKTITDFLFHFSVFFKWRSNFFPV